MKLILKYSFFFSILLSIFGIRGAKLVIRKCKGGVLMFQGQIGEIPVLSPEKLGLFLVLTLFFHPSLPKIGYSHSVNNYFCE